ncbi:MAG: diaminopimelate dehydrogenase, partial [Clostridia bacterium]|nr:diaminopimelate dehydrogenase [Clostridia bacterium]
MEKLIKAAVYGYGNLGRGVESALAKAPDMELTAIYTRRDPSAVKSLTGAAVRHESELTAGTDVDVVI